MRRLQMAAIYVGGFVGPFTGQALAVVLPEFAETFGISVGQAAWTMSAYLFPFAAMLLVSARLVNRIHPHRVVLTAYAVTLPMALLLLITPSWGLFLAAYATIGIANAFTTPVLQNMLRELTPSAKLGSALGTYAAMQSLGMLSAPLVAGLSSLISWRLTFLVTAAAAAYVLIVRLPVVPPPAASPQKVTGRVRWVPTLVHMGTSFVVGVGIIGLGFLTSLQVGDAFGLGPVGRGLVVMCGGTAAFFASRRIGAMADRYGVRAVLVSSGLLAAVALSILPVAPWVWVAALAWAAAVMAAQGMQATVNLAVINAPGGSSLISTVQAFRFGGSAAAPVLFLPIYLGIGGAAFWVSAAALVLAAVAQQLVRVQPERQAVGIPVVDDGADDDVLEHRDEQAAVLVLAGDLAGGVVDGAVDAPPVELPAGVAGDPAPEQPLHAPVAFPERVDVVDLVVVVGQAGDEAVPVESAQAVLLLQLPAGDGRGVPDHRHRQEGFPATGALAQVDGPEFARPVIDVLEKVAVDAAQLVKVVGACGRMIQQLEHPHK